MANTLEIPAAAGTLEFEDRMPLWDNPEKLRRAAAEDGYLFLRGLLPREPVMELRRQILEIVERYGWLRKGSDPGEARADLPAIAATDGIDDSLKYIGVTRDAYRDIQSLELFHALPHHPRLMALYEKLFEAAVFPHPRNIARVLLPAPSYAPTPPHQDYVFIQGTPNAWTCWLPLGDCPVTLGGLSVLHGSHREKVLNVAAASGAGQRESILCGKDYQWVQRDFQCGDIVTFPSHMVHKGLPNQMGDRVRISCDFRYQPADEEIEEKSLAPHMGVIEWDEVYRGWRNKSLQYYWKTNSLKLSAWDDSLLQTREKIC